MIKAAAVPSQQGFGTILFAAFHTVTVGPRVSTVTSIQDAEDQGFTAAAAPAISRALTVAFSQNPRPPLIKIGRRELAYTQTLTLDVLAAQGEDFVWEVVIRGVTFSFTEGAAETPTTIATGLRAAINGGSLAITASGATVQIILTADTAGDLFAIKADPDLFDIVDTTADPGLATDLAAIENEDSDWYLLAIDSQSEAEVLAAAEWVETRVKLLAADAYESGVIDALDTGDVASQLQTLSRLRTYLSWTDGRAGDYYALGWAAFVLSSFDPGRSTWAFKPTAGVEAYLLNGTQVATLESKEVNWRGELAGVQVWQPGRVSGAEWIDVVRTDDFIAVRERELIEAQLIQRPKISYTAADFAALEGILLNFLVGLTIPAGGGGPVLAPDPIPTVSFPDPVNVPDADRGNRVLRDVVTTARRAGAVQDVEVTTILQF